MSVNVWDDEFKQYIPAILNRKPAAWRWRHGHHGPWTYSEERPKGPSIHLFIVEPLYSGHNATLAHRTMTNGTEAMRNTLKIECLIEALDRYWDAKREEEEARGQYEGPSWGYFGRHYIERKEDAAEEIQKRLDEYIDARIAATRT